jgi:hypothetical protein
LIAGAHALKIELERVVMDRTSKLEGSTLTVYSGLPHDMCATYKGQINTDLLAFINV